MAKDKEKKQKAPKEGKGGGLAKIVGIAVPTLLGVVVGFVLGGRGGGTAEAAPETTTTTMSTIPGDVIEVDTMTFSLVGEPGRYARVGFAVVLSADAETTVVGQRVPLLRDAALTVMSDFSSEELASKAGMKRLRQALTDKALELFPDGEVLEAVLTELIVQ